MYKTYRSTNRKSKKVEMIFIHMNDVCMCVYYILGGLWEQIFILR